MDNPAKKVRTPDVVTPEPGILTVEETEALFRANEKVDPEICGLLAALCRPETKVYACASSISETGWRQVNGKAFLNKSNSGNIAFRLDYENGIRIGDFQDKPKVQKYHTQKEFHQLWTHSFRSVKVRELSNNITAECAHARPVDAERLRAAIEFEFDLPYPDGTRMGMVKKAKEAFSKRLGIAL
jgi:hypothetical protein